MGCKSQEGVQSAIFDGEAQTNGPMVFKLLSDNVNVFEIHFSHSH
jgi:hypothetical protein